MQFQDVVEEVASAEQQRRAFFFAALILCVVAAIVPFASTPLRALPNISGIYGALTAVVNLATFWLLISAPYQPRSHAVIAAAYLFAGLMAVVYLLSFPGAVIPNEPVFGSKHAVSWLFVVWRAGFALFIIWAALCEGQRGSHDRGNGRAPTVVALLAVLGGVIGSQLTDVAATKDEGGRQFFGLFSLYGAYVAALLTAAAVALVLWQKLHRRAIFVWLIVVLAAEAAGLWLSTYSGARYTLAWYAVRVEGVIASSLLLLLLAQHFRLVQRRLASTVSSLQTRTEELQAAIHRRASAETQLAQSEKLRLVGQLGAGLAHDLNNILQVITGRLSILRRRVGDVGDADIQIVRQNVKKAEALTRQLSLLSTRRTMTVRAFAPGDDLARIAETTQLLLGKQHKLIFEAENQLPTITVDPLELEIAVTNLVTNARDALANGGVIEILARARAMPDGNPGLAVTVKDGGIGMAKELQNRIFEPFFTTKPQGKGTGLGLSQIAAFVESAGGTVEVVSTVGEGTAVTLLLPGVVAGRDAAPGSVDACSGLNFAGKTVLLVDDNDDVREASSQLLETFGFVVKAARSGEEALEGLSTGFSPEFVVSDIVMDGMHGVELLRIIRKSHPAIRSVLVSGHSDIAQAAAQEGFVVIAKPYDVTVLLEALVIR